MSTSQPGFVGLSDRTTQLDARLYREHEVNRADEVRSTWRKAKMSILARRHCKNEVWPSDST